jgi:aminoglycoside/choline kinase family phosphotransferase
LKADITQWIIQLFERWSGEKVVELSPLPESGSYRRYYRIKSENKCVLGAFNTDLKENDAFLYLASHLKKTGNLVPEVFAIDSERGIYLLEDLGNTTLLDYIQLKQTDPSEITTIYKKVIDAMPGLQVRAAEGLDFSHCYPRAEFEYQSMHWDLNYFKYCFLKPLKISFDEQELEDDFVVFISFLLEAQREFFMFRDFQSRNIMIHNNKIYFIDFQGGRRGPLQYDLASLLFEAKTNLPAKLKHDLLNYYLDVFEKQVKNFNRNEFLKYYCGFVYIRLMQAMGAYGFRGYIERKPLFLQSVPLAALTLEWLLNNTALPVELPALRKVFEKIVLSKEIKEFIPVHDTLTISINSFSYMNGIPSDNSGHGGGFVFDCRALTNPGRFDEFKDLTGNDEAVIRFLDEKDDMKEFLNHVISLVDQSIRVYMQRGFNSLMVNFGCTGGQHRSVYAANKLAEYIRNNFPLRVIINHRELEK